ncbi:MAG: hypothetical protein KGZ58_01790 [Ignavibacteriales bacterium]|nr:hypothetical protein [Ignavibacteriales bacterium]
MAFNGNEGSFITLSEAGQLTSNHRQAIPAAIKGEFFGKEKLQQILDEDKCIGIRCYYGEGGNGDWKLVLVGADEDENDLTDGYILETGYPCPPNCGNDNELNSD